MNWIRKNGYKAIGIGLLLYGMLYGLTVSLPELGILQQSSRVVFYHVPMWFVVITLMGISVYHSVRYLRLTDPDYDSPTPPWVADVNATSAAHIGIFFIMLGLLTGMAWLRVAWHGHIAKDSLSVFWANDPILIVALISLLIYLAYFLLRASFQDEEQKAKVAAVYNIFAFATLIPLYFIIPQMLPGLHPTADGSDAGGGSFIFNRDGFDNTYRMILYPTMIGFICLSIWIYNVKRRWGIANRTLENYLSDLAYEKEKV